MSNTKISIRFFDNREVRAIWDGENAKWMFSVLDIVGVLTDQDDYTKTRNYWKYLKPQFDSKLPFRFQLKFEREGGFMRDSRLSRLKTTNYFKELIEKQI